MATIGPSRTGLSRAAQPPSQVGNYQLIEQLSSGGMGEVWSATHVRLGRPAAVKLIRPELIRSDPGRLRTVLRRFEREAQAMSQLRSPHTVEIYDFGATDDATSFFYAMERLEGTDLRRLVERYGPITPERTVSLLLQVCESLAEAHRGALIHRDIKPANLFLCRVGIRVDFVKVLDFGLVKGLSQALENTQLTLQGSATGSPAFMAPEVVLENDVDARTDLYSLGCVAYWLLTGRLVFDASTPMKMVMAHVKQAPTPPSELVELPIPAELERLIMDCLAKEPGKRPQSAEQLAQRLAAVPLADAWSAARARRWWQTHIPSSRANTRDRAAPATRLPSSDDLVKNARSLSDADSPSTPPAVKPAAAGDAAARSPAASIAAGPTTEVVDPATSPSATAPLRITSVFSGTMREGFRTIPPRVRLRTLLGGLTLDLRRATFAQRVTEIRCTALLGRITVVVPPSVRLVSDGSGVFGSFGHDMTPGCSDDAWVVRLSGSATFGVVRGRVRAP